MSASARHAGETRTPLIPGLLALLASGCATGLGPRAVRSERPDYNQQDRPLRPT